MKKIAIAIPLACGMLVMASAMPMPIQSLVVTSASAQYSSQGGARGRDNVFLPGEPRWGSSSRVYLDRNRQYRGGMQRGAHYGQQSQQRFGTTSQSRSFVRWRRLTIVRGAAAAPVVQEQPRARCGGTCVVKARPTCGTRCIVKRPTCGTRCKPKCSTCGTAAGPRQTNTAKVSGVKSVVKGNGNAVNQTVTINQTNVYGGSAAARSSAASGGDCSVAVTGMRMRPKPAAHAVRGRNPNTGQCTWIY